MDSTIRAWLSFILTGPYSSVLPFAIVPLFSAWIVQHLMSRVERISLEPAWRAILGGVGACVPGLVTLCLVNFSTYYIPRISPGDFGCYVKIYGPLCLVLILVARAVTLCLIRGHRISQLKELTTQPSERLVRLSAELRLAVSELATPVPICMTVGFLSPRILVSTGAVAQFSDQDLRAALLHERAHVVNGHTRIRAFISLFSECGLWRATNALNLYAQACEEIADEEAAHEVGPLVLAAVLVRFARVSWNLPFAEAFAKKNGLERRVRRLLEPPVQAVQDWTNMLLLVALCLTLCLAAYPQVARVAARSLFNCTP